MGRAEGLAGDTVANADDVTTIPRRLLTERAGVLAESKLKALDRALAFALALT